MTKKVRGPKLKMGKKKIAKAVEQVMDGGGHVLVSTPGMQDVAKGILKTLKKKHGISLAHQRIEYTQFANGELLPRIQETVRGKHVFFLIALQHPDPNIAIMKMHLMNDALKRASAASITLVTPYLPYLRQDRKDKPRVPISARLLADQIESNKKVERVITTDMHADQEQGFFAIPVDNLTSMKLFAEFINHEFEKQLRSGEVVVVAADFGGAVRARRFSVLLGNAPVTIFEKRRTGANQAHVVSMIGESVKGKIAIIYEDMIDTGGTIREVSAELRAHGANDVIVFATHGIFSSTNKIMHLINLASMLDQPIKDKVIHALKEMIDDGAEAQFAKANLKIYTTNSIPREAQYLKENASWLTQIPMDELLADAIHQAFVPGGSISKLLL